MINNYEPAFQADELRATLGKDNLSQIDVFSIARNIPRLTTVLYPLGDNISGMCVKQEKFSLIAVNSTQSYGRQRFTLAHELYHLHFDEQIGTSICPSDSSKYDDVERKADLFASHFILPYLALRNEVKERGLLEGAKPLDDEFLLEAAIAIEQRYLISHKALLIRLTELGILGKEQRERLQGGITKKARQLGYSGALYEPRRGSYQKQVDGEYVDLIVQLFSEGAISQGKAEELLADGFRDDIMITSIAGEDLVD